MRAIARLRNAWRSLTGALGAVWLPISSTIGGFGNWDGDTDPGTWQKGITRSALPMLAFSAVYACIAIISGDVAKLGCSVWRKRADGGYDEATTYPLYRLLRNPNAYQTSMDFWQAWMISTLLAGNAYIKVDYDNRFVPVAWHVLDPRYVQVLIAEDGSIFYHCSQNRLAGLPDAEAVIYTQRDIIHHRMMCLAHPLIGVTPLYACASSAMLGVAASRQSRTFFENQSRPSGVLTAPGKIDKETATRIKADWEENTRAGNSGRAMVLGGGLGWTPLTISSTDSQLIDQLRWSGEDVARAFRVPGFMLGDLSKVTYKNSEQLMRAYYSGCLQYHLEALEARLDQFFGLAANGVEVEFDVTALLRTEMDVRFSAYQTAMQSGFMFINQVRRIEGWGDVEGGDEPLVQAQYRPLSMVLSGKAAPDSPDSGTTAPAADAPPPSDTGGDAASGSDSTSASAAVQAFLQRLSDGLPGREIATGPAESQHAPATAVSEAVPA